MYILIRIIRTSPKPATPPFINQRQTPDIGNAHFESTKQTKESYAIAALNDRIYNEAFNTVRKSSANSGTRPGSASIDR